MAKIVDFRVFSAQNTEKNEAGNMLLFFELSESVFFGLQNTWIL